MLINDPLLAGYSPKPYLAVLENVVKTESPRVVLLGSTSIGLDVGPCWAKAQCPGNQRLSERFGRRRHLKGDGQLLRRETAGRRDRRCRAGNSLDGAGTFQPTDSRGAAQVETKDSPVPLDMGAVAFEEMILPDATDVDITRQEVLVGVGRGIQQEDNLEVAEQLAQALGGVLAASRPIVDQGWLPTTRQVGKSGMTVKPKCFFALGISGAPEHVEGMKDSALIIAVNTDPNAPIFDVAHYGVVADLLDVAPAITDAIKGG